jgi:hypothetical protein
MEKHNPNCRLSNDYNYEFFDPDSNTIIPFFRSGHISDYYFSETEIIHEALEFLNQITPSFSILMGSLVFAEIARANDGDFTKFTDNTTKNPYFPTTTVDSPLSLNRNNDGGVPSSKNSNFLYLGLVFLMSLVTTQGNPLHIVKEKEVTKVLSLTNSQKLVNFYKIHKNAIKVTSGIACVSTVSFFAIRHLLKIKIIKNWLKDFLESPIELVGTGIRLIPNSAKDIAKIYEINPEICSFLQEFKRLVIKIDRIKDRFVNGIPEDLKQEFYEHLNEFKRFIVAVDTDVFEGKNSTTIIAYYLHTYLAQFKSTDAFELYSRSAFGGQIQMDHDFDHKMLFKTYRTIKQLQSVICPEEK